MTKVTIDAGTWEKLFSVREIAELCDESGRIIGTFHPGPQRDGNGNVVLPISDDEIDRRSRQNGGRRLSEILDDLSKL